MLKFLKGLMDSENWKIEEKNVNGTYGEYENITLFKNNQECYVVDKYKNDESMDSYCNRFDVGLKFQKFQPTYQNTINNGSVHAEIILYRNTQFDIPALVIYDYIYNIKHYIYDVNSISIEGIDSIVLKAKDKLKLPQSASLILAHNNLENKSY